MQTCYIPKIYLTTDRVDWNVLLKSSVLEEGKDWLDINVPSTQLNGTSQLWPCLVPGLRDPSKFFEKLTFCTVGP